MNDKIRHPKTREFPEGRSERVSFSLPKKVSDAFKTKYPNHGDISDALTRLVKQDLGLV